jgi:ArsR family transcriptional regulator
MLVITDTFKLLSDKLRLRILLLLGKKELCVCQLMGILESSQSLISRNLSLLYRARFLDERRQGKLRFYSIKHDITGERKAVMDFILNILKTDKTIKNDLKTLKKCAEFQKKTGKCDMNTLNEFRRMQRERNTNV